MIFSARSCLPSASAPAADAYPLRDPNGSDFYFDPTVGSDGSGSSASPFKTWSQARLQALSAGQQFVVMSGSSILPVEARGLPSGTANNLITVRPYPGHSPTLAFTSATVMGGGDYWDWRGFNYTTSADSAFDLAGNNPDSGALVPINHWRFIDMNGTKLTAGSGGNSGLLKIRPGAEYVSYIRGSLIGTGLESANNQAGIWMDVVAHFECIGTLVKGFNIPFYFKHNHQLASNQVSILFKNCIIRDKNRGMLMVVSYATFQNCAFQDTQLSFSDNGGNGAGDYNNLVHCTFFNSTTDMNPPGPPLDLIDGAFGNTIKNCVFTATPARDDNRYGTFSSLDQQTDAHHNAYTTGSVIGRNGSYRTLTAHKAAFPGTEASSVSGTIVLVNNTSPADTPANWALHSSSIGRSAADDGTDMGVDISKLLTVN